MNGFSHTTPLTAWAQYLLSLRGLWRLRSGGKLVVSKERQVVFLSHITSFTAWAQYLQSLRGRALKTASLARTLVMGKVLALKPETKTRSNKAPPNLWQNARPSLSRNKCVGVASPRPYPRPRGDLGSRAGAPWPRTADAGVRSALTSASLARTLVMGKVLALIPGVRFFLEVLDNDDKRSSQTLNPQPLTTKNTTQHAFLLKPSIDFKSKPHAKCGIFQDWATAIQRHTALFRSEP